MGLAKDVILTHRQTLRMNNLSHTPRIWPGQPAGESGARGEAR